MFQKIRIVLLIHIQVNFTTVHLPLQGLFAVFLLKSLSPFDEKLSIFYDAFKGRFPILHNIARSCFFCRFPEKHQKTRRFSLRKIGNVFVFCQLPFSTFRHIIVAFLIMTANASLVFPSRSCPAGAFCPPFSVAILSPLLRHGGGRAERIRSPPQKIRLFRKTRAASL